MGGMAIQVDLGRVALDFDSMTHTDTTSVWRALVEVESLVGLAIRS